MWRPISLINVDAKMGVSKTRTRTRSRGRGLLFFFFFLPLPLFFLYDINNDNNQWLGTNRESWDGFQSFSR